MGLTSDDHARLLANLTPTIELRTNPSEVEIEYNDRIDPDRARLIPCFDGSHGMPGGCAIPGTRPGDGLHLNDTGRDTLRHMLRKARGR